MGYVQLILDSRKKIQTTPSGSVPLLDLPGFKRREGMIEDEQMKAQREYTSAVERLRSLNKKIKSVKGEAKKDIRSDISRLKDHMNNLLSRVGPYSSDQRLFGFKEENHGF